MPKIWREDQKIAKKFYNYSDLFDDKEFVENAKIFCDNGINMSEKLRINDGKKPIKFMKQYIKEPDYREREKFFLVDGFIFCTNKDYICTLPSVVSVFGIGSLFTCVGGTGIVGMGMNSCCLWCGVSTNSLIAGYCLVATIGNQIQRKIYKVKVEEENEELYRKVKEKSEKKYNYPEAFQSKNLGSHKIKNDPEAIHTIFLKEFRKIFKNSNSNTDFQEKIERIQEDYEVFTSQVFFSSFTKQVPFANIINEAIKIVNLERRCKTEEIETLLSLEKKSTWGFVFKAIDSFLPNFLEKMIIDFCLREKNIILADSDLDGYMKDILKNKEKALVSAKNRTKSFSAEMIME